MQAFAEAHAQTTSQAGSGFKGPACGLRVSCVAVPVESMARPPGLIPAPPPEHQLQRRLHMCPHTGAVRVALTRVAPVPPDRGVPADGKDFSTVLRRLHAAKCHGRVRQLPRRRLPIVAATAKAATEATSVPDSAASAPARPISRVAPRTSSRFGSRTAAGTLAAERGHEAAASIAREVVDNVLEACIADIGFEGLLADGEARVGSAHRAVRSARVHDGCGYLRHAKERLVERMNTPCVDVPKQDSPDSRMEYTPREGGPPLQDSHLHHTPPRAWGFATEQTAEHHCRAVTPRAIDVHRQRSARRRMELFSAIDPLATTATASGAGAESRPYSPAQSLKAKLAAHKRVAVKVRGGGILTARVWAPQSTPETRRALDPVARPFPFAGTKPLPATTRDHYVYPAVPNHYHLASESASDHANGNGTTSLSEATYTSVQLKQVDRRRVAHVSHTEAAHAAQHMLRNGPNFRWEKGTSGGLVVAIPSIPASARSTLSGVLPARSAGHAWAAAVEHPLPERDYLNSWGSGDGLRERLETPLTVRHLLSAGAIKQNVG
jgi:hypothetical protein